MSHYMAVSDGFDHVARGIALVTSVVVMTHMVDFLLEMCS